MLRGVYFVACSDIGVNMDAYGGSLHQTVILPNRIPGATSGMTRYFVTFKRRVVLPSVFLCSMSVYGGMPSNSYLLEPGGVFDQPLLSPSSQLLNEALEPMDDEETLRMDEEPSNNIEEPLNNVAHNIYAQELPNLNLFNSAQVCVMYVIHFVVV